MKNESNSKVYLTNNMILIIAAGKSWKILLWCEVPTVINSKGFPIPKKLKINFNGILVWFEYISNFGLLKDFSQETLLNSIINEI